MALKNSAGRWVSDQREVKQLVLTFFEQVYMAEPLEGDFMMLAPPARRVLQVHHLDQLAQVPQDDEIHRALKTMAPWKAPGPDGFQAGFYQTNWSVVRRAVCNFVRDAFTFGHFDASFSKVLVVLIPKVDHPELASQFRPISLCNVTVKLISKLIVNRLRPFLHEFISPTQSSFIPGRGTTDNIVVLQEAIHSLSKKRGKRGGMIMKVDLEKAYDRINWEFLRWVLMDFGLPSTLVSLIMFCVTSTEMSMMWNGEMTAFTKPTRGLRQGDPLSPYLFVLCLQKLSALIDQDVELGTWRSISCSRNGPLLSHLFFADV